MPVAIVAGMSGTMMDSSTAVVTGRDVAPYAGWTTGYLVFRGTPTRDVLAALTRWYGYEFRLTDSALAQSNLTIGLSTESAAEALQILQQTLNVELAFEGHVITVRPRRAGRTTVTNRLDERSVLATPRMEIGR
jgi:ferric-dicitrate binding protein FerR (iron transport regulator)